MQIEEQITSSKEPVSKEIKSIVEKILTQIEFFQLSSYTSNSSHAFLSFLQDDIDDVDIKFNNTANESVSCQINLVLKKYGNLKVLIVLDKKTILSINIGIEDSKFKQIIHNNLQKLRVGINKIGLSLQSLNIFELSNKSITNINEYDKNTQNTNLSFGLDIKA